MLEKPSWVLSPGGAHHEEILHVRGIWALSRPGCRVWTAWGTCITLMSAEVCNQIVLQTWLKFRLSGGSVGDTGTECKKEPGAPASHAAIVFVLPLSPLSASHQWDLCAGLYDGEREQQLMNACPAPEPKPSRTLPGLCPAQPASSFTC